MTSSNFFFFDTNDLKKNKRSSVPVLHIINFKFMLEMQWI